MNELISLFQRGASKKRFKTEVAKDLPDIRGKEVAAFWYKTVRNYYFLKDPKVLHAHACKFTENKIVHKNEVFL